MLLHRKTRQAFSKSSASANSGFGFANAFSAQGSNAGFDAAFPPTINNNNNNSKGAFGATSSIAKNDPFGGGSAAFDPFAGSGFSANFGSNFGVSFRSPLLFSFTRTYFTSFTQFLCLSIHPQSTRELASHAQIMNLPFKINLLLAYPLVSRRSHLLVTSRVETRDTPRPSCPALTPAPRASRPPPPCRPRAGPSGRHRPKDRPLRAARAAQVARRRPSRAPIPRWETPTGAGADSRTLLILILR